MVDIDEKLLLLNNYLKTEPFNRANIAQLLDITERQLTRLLKKWDGERLIEYEGGVGRGNTSDINFLVNVEQAFINMIIRNLPQYSLEEINELMSLPLTEDSLKILESAMDTLVYNQLSDIQNSSEVAVDRIAEIPHEFHPLKHTESSPVITFNVMDRLYEEDEYGLIPNLVAEDEWVGNSLYIYLYRDIKFSNGQLLFAAEVVNCLNDLITNKNFKEKYKNIKGITLVNTFALKIDLHKKTEDIKQLLTNPEASIYKERNNKLITTGCYTIEHHDDRYIKLHQSEGVHHHVADLKDVYLVDSVELIEQYHMEEKTISKDRLLDAEHNSYQPVYKNIIKNSFGIISYGKIIVDN